MLNEINKMGDWKGWLKGVVDGWPADQALVVTGSARMETFHVRAKDGAEVDFALSRDSELTHLIECKLSDDKPHRALTRFATEFPATTAVEVVRHLRQEQVRERVEITAAGPWLATLAA